MASKFKNKSKSKRPAVGCAYLLIVGIATSVLLAINIGIVGTLIVMNKEWLYSFYPDDVVQFRFAQSMQIFIPVVLTFVQFWIFDRIVDRAFGYGRKSRSQSSA